jgi:sugar lactone lactonase YvrE
MNAVSFEVPAFDVLGDVRTRVGESPLWSASESALWWVDIEGRQLHRLAGGVHSSWTTHERLACIALHDAGGLLAAMETGVFRLQVQPDGALKNQLAHERLASVRHPREGMRLNDGRCDRAGRFWVSSMVRDMSLGAADGALYRLDGLDARGLSKPLVGGLVTGNGLGFSPDARVLYLSDSHPSVRRIWAYALNDDGTLGARREFVDMNLYPGRPDGAAVDADGCYWICGNDAGALLRFTPEGVLDRALKLPISKPSMCSFGGPALDELYVTSIIPAAPVSGFVAALDGALLRVRPGVQGLAETPFRSVPVPVLVPFKETT